MPFVSGGHLWLILILLVIVLIVWGPGKLPEVGSGLGRAIREFKRASSDTHEQLTGAIRPAPGGTGAAAPPVPAAGEPPTAVGSPETGRAAGSRPPEDHRVSG